MTVTFGLKAPQVPPANTKYPRSDVSGFSGVKDGLDDSIKAEILMDTMTTIKDDVSDLCGAESTELRWSTKQRS